MTIEDPSLSAHGYQLLSIATSYLVGNNRNLIFKHILRCFIHCLYRGTYDHKRPITEWLLLPIVAPSNQSVSG